MRRLFARMNPTLRGFLIIALIVIVVMVLNLYGTLAALGILLRVAFFLAIAFFIFLMWRERRDEIGGWGTGGGVVFFGSGFLIVGAGGAFFWGWVSGY